MVFHWHDSYSEKFLDLYRHYECLWNTTHGSYSCRLARDTAYNEICQKMNLPGLNVHHVRNKINTMRTTYKVLLNKIIRSEKSGGTYVPRLFWFKRADQFLRGTAMRNMCTPRRINRYRQEMESKRKNERNSRFSNFNNNGDSTSKFERNSTKNYQEDSCLNTVDSSPKQSEDELSGNMMTMESTPLQSERTNAESFTNSITINELTTLRTNTITPAGNSPHFIILQKSLSKLQNILDRRKNISDDDEFDLFGKSIALQLKRMPLERALTCQENLQRVMARERLYQLELSNENDQNQHRRYKAISID